MRVVVIGAGAFGCWTAWYLQRGGASVTLVEAESPAHEGSSSGGRSRVTRAAYGGDSTYARMTARSLAEWRELERSSGEQLFWQCGLLWLMGEDDRFVRDSLPVCEELGVPLVEVSPRSLADRVPGLRSRGLESAFWEPQAGVLAARRTCRLLVEQCRERGAAYVQDRLQPVAGSPGSDGTELPSVGSSSRSLSSVAGVERLYAADAFVIAAGAGMPRLFPSLLQPVLRPTRQEVFFFGPVDGGPDLRKLPVWFETGRTMKYAIPDLLGEGVKCGDDSRSRPFDPESDERITSREGLEAIRSYLALRMPALAEAPLRSSKVCAYVNSPQGHLLIDRHPSYENVWLVGAGSGHGFKLSPAVGELVSDWVLHGRAAPPRFSLEAMDPDDPRSPYEPSRLSGS